MKKMFIIKFNFYMKKLYIKSINYFYYAIINHCGRIQTINFLHNNNWYWHRMNREVQATINLCANCNKPHKFKKLKIKLKVILDDGPHYLYVADLWKLCKEIKNMSGYSYVIDIIDHFSKFYYGYFLNTKKAKEVKKNRYFL